MLFCNQWLSFGCSRGGTRGEATSENTFTNTFRGAAAPRQTGQHCGNVWFGKGEESASPRRFNYSYESVLDFQRGVGTVHIQATQRIKHHAAWIRGTRDKDAEPPSVAETESEWELNGKSWGEDEVHKAASHLKLTGDLRPPVDSHGPGREWNISIFCCLHTKSRYSGDVSVFWNV